MFLVSLIVPTRLLTHASDTVPSDLGITWSAYTHKPLSLVVLENGGTPEEAIETKDYHVLHLTYDSQKETSMYVSAIEAIGGECTVSIAS